MNEYTLKISNGRTIRVLAKSGGDAMKKAIKLEKCTPDEITVIDVRKVEVYRRPA